VSCPRIQCNVPRWDSNLDCSIWRWAHLPWGHGTSSASAYSVPVLRGYWPLELSGMEQRWEIHTEKNNLLLMHGLLADTKFSVKSISRLTREHFFLCQLLLLFSTCVKCVDCNMLWLTEPSGIWRVRSGGVRYDKSRNTLSSYSVSFRPLSKCNLLPSFQDRTKPGKANFALGQVKIGIQWKSQNALSSLKFESERKCHFSKWQN